MTGSITFNGEATCNININVQGDYTVSPTSITQTEANQRCYTNIKNNGVTIDYNSIHNSELILDYVKNNATDVIVARGGNDNSASNVTTHNKAMLVRSGNSKGNINFMAYTHELPNGEYTVKFRYKDSNSVTHELYVTFVMAIPEPTEITVTPNTVSENGVVGQATSFDLTLSGDSTYTYTQTFGNICNVSINGDTATVTITPTTSGTLTGSITFNEEATCNITIAVSEPTPQEYSLTPATVSDSVTGGEDKDFTLTLAVGSDFSSADITYSGSQYGGISLSDSTMSGAGDFTVNYIANEVDATDVFTVTATCHRTGGLPDIVLTSTFNIVISPAPEPTYSLTPTTVNDKLVEDKSYTLTLSVGSDFDYADIDYNGNQYGEVSLSDSTMSSAGEFTVNYHATDFEGENISDVFTVTATCHRTGGLSDIVLTSTFTIQQYE